MAAENLAPGTTVGELDSTGCFQWDGIVWLPYKINHDNSFDVSDAAGVIGASVAERMSLLAGVGTWTFRGNHPTETGVTRRAIGTDAYWVRVATGGILTAYTDQALTEVYGTFRYVQT